MNILKFFTQKNTSPENLTTLTVNLDGMHCASCSLLIDDTVEEIEGVESSKTSYRQGKTVVTFDPQKVEKEQITSAITKLGYRVKN